LAVRHGFALPNISCLSRTRSGSSPPENDTFQRVIHFAMGDEAP
jgi:hypothetical protein